MLCFSIVNGLRGTGHPPQLLLNSRWDNTIATGFQHRRHRGATFSNLHCCASSSATFTNLHFCASSSAPLTNLQCCADIHCCDFCAPFTNLQCCSFHECCANLHFCAFYVQLHRSPISSVTPSTRVAPIFTVPPFTGASFYSVAPFVSY